MDLNLTIAYVGLCMHQFTTYTVRLQRISGDVERVWQSLGSKKGCDTNAGEVYMREESDNFSDLEACQASCENAADCQSITFYKSGWCSHYSTPCTKPTLKRSAVGAMRLVGE